MPTVELATGSRCAICWLDPRQKTLQVSLPGPAIFEIRGGAGLIAAGKSTEVRVGSTLAVPEGEVFTIESKGNTAITLRVHLFVAD